jgi:hypothetical protein
MTNALAYIQQRWRFSCEFKSRKIGSRSQSYDFWIHNYNASIVVG